MTTTTKQETKTAAAAPIKEAAVGKGYEVARPAKRSLAEQLKVRGINEAQWHTLTGSLFPGAKIESVLLLIDYCRARGLDPLKRPAHIVPMEVKVGEDKWEWRDVILPGIYELRTTAHRTGVYLGHTPPEFGETAEFGGVEAPYWCSMIFKRAVGERVAEFPVVVFFSEICGTKRDGSANARWSKAPRQMMAKVCEAAGLREAFPEELGGQMAAEESDTAGRIETVATTTETGNGKPAMGGTGADANEMNRELGLTDETARAASALDHELGQESVDASAS